MFSLTYSPNQSTIALRRMQVRFPPMDNLPSENPQHQAWHLYQAPTSQIFH